MNKLKELRIDSTSWATPARLVNLLDFEPEEISIETENNANNNIKVLNIRYKNQVWKYGKTFLKLLTEDMVS